MTPARRAAALRKKAAARMREAEEEAALCRRLRVEHAYLREPFIARADGGRRAPRHWSIPEEMDL
jgi:hypothetical protein